MSGGTFLKDARIYHINSRLSEPSNSNCGDFTFTFDASIRSFPDVGTKVCLMYASIPISYYNVPDGANSFVVYSTALPGNSITVTFIPANYTRTTLQKQLINLFNAAFLAYGGAQLTVQSSTSAVADNGKYKFTVTGTAPGLSFNFGKVGMFEQLGFIKETTNAFVGNILESVNVTNLQNESTLYIHSNICQSQNNILAAIYAPTTPSFAYIVYQPPDIQAYALPFSGNIGDTFYFRVATEEGQILFFNGVNLLLTVLLWIDPLPILKTISTQIEELAGDFVNYIRQRLDEEGRKMIKLEQIQQQQETQNATKTTEEEIEPPKPSQAEEEQQQITKLPHEELALIDEPPLPPSVPPPVSRATIAKQIVANPEGPQLTHVGEMPVIEEPGAPPVIAISEPFIAGEEEIMFY